MEGSGQTVIHSSAWLLSFKTESWHTRNRLVPCSGKRPNANFGFPALFSFELKDIKNEQVDKQWSKTQSVAY